MDEKTCSKCNVLKSLREFYKSPTHSTGYRSVCISCNAKQNISWFERNPNYLEKNKEKKVAARKKWKTNNPNSSKEWYNSVKTDQKFIEHQRARRKKWHLENPDSKKKWYNKVKGEEWYKIKIKNKREKYKKRRNELQKKRLKEDHGYRLLTNLRIRLNSVVKLKKDRSIDILGCKVSFYKNFIESHFTKEMKWNNIHIDHIIPVTLFDMTNPEEVKKAFHWTNTRPLLKAANLSKNDKLPEDYHLRFWIDTEVGWEVINYAA